MTSSSNSTTHLPIILVHEARETWIEENGHLHSVEVLARSLAPTSEIAKVAASLISLGYDCRSFTYRTFCPNKFRKLSSSLSSPACFWNLTDGCDFYSGSLIPSFARLLGHRHIASPTYAQALSQYKHHWKSILRQLGILTPSFVTVHDRSFQENDNITRAIRDLPLPVFTKPSSIGDSGGLDITNPICETFDDITANLQTFLSNDISPILCEPFLEGDEFAYIFAGNEKPIELTVQHIYSGSFQSAQLKDNPSAAGCVTRPAPNRTDLIQIGQNIVSTLGLRDYAKIDFRTGSGGTPYVIDVNAMPFLTSGSFAALCEYHDLTFENLIKLVVRPHVEIHGTDPLSQTHSDPSLVEPGSRNRRNVHK